MADSIFKVHRSDTLPALEDILIDQTPAGEEDDTANLLVIPISQEIAADFTLIGYDDTIRRIEEVLTQRGKQRNVMLFGGQGVGKTSITHGLVQRKNNNDLSTHMYKRMFSRLNSSLLLHTDNVSDINKQFDQVLQEFGRYDVLVIENFYTLITYLRTKGANVVLVGFLEALSRRKLQSIITCSTREKALILTEIPEVHEYFAPLELHEPNNDDLLNILRGVHRSYEARYAISMTDEALCSARDLTQKYRNGMEGWSQPGRALILVDRAIAQFSVRMNSKPSELAELENEAENIGNEIESLTPNTDEIHFISDSDSERREGLIKRLNKLKPQMDEMRHQWELTTAPIQKLQNEKLKYERKHHEYITQRRKLQDMRGDNAALIEHNTDVTTVSSDIAQLSKMIGITVNEIKRLDDELGKINLSDQRDHVVTDENIAQTFSELSGISVKQLTENERERVVKMEEILGDRVKGQPEALTAVSNAVRRAKANLSDDEGTPKGSFLFLGPSGVGKTELGKALAEFDTGSDKNIVEIDMSEFMEKHSVSKLIGAPPGYAGYDDGGVLTNAVDRHPKSVVLLDEIEKAHEDIFKILLQVMGAGRLTDGRGVTVDFRETYIIMTSNAGSSYFLDEHLSYEQASQMALKEVNRFLLPEIRGRLDEIICFHRLGLPMLEQIAKRRIQRINRVTEAKKLKLILPDDAITQFCQVYQDSSYGARAILAGLKKTLERVLAMEILAPTEASKDGVLNATFDGQSFVLA